MRLSFPFACLMSCVPGLVPHCLTLPQLGSFPVPSHGCLAQSQYPDTPLFYLSCLSFPCSSYIGTVLGLGIDLA